MKRHLFQIALLVGSLSCFAAGQAGTKPVKAVVIPTKSGQSSEVNQVGNIKITFDDGHSEVVTTDGQCTGAEVSKRGDIVWDHFTGSDRMGYPIDEKLILRTVDGKTRELKPETGYPYVRNSGFSPDQSAVVVMWGGRHSTPIFLKYAIATGKVTERSEVGDYNKLPKWAKPIAKGESSIANSQ
jgi:hypothetical protein